MSQTAVVDRSPLRRAQSALVRAEIRGWAILLLLVLAGCSTRDPSRRLSPLPDAPPPPDILRALPEPTPQARYSVSGVLCYGDGQPYVFLLRSDVPLEDLARSPFLCIGVRDLEGFERFVGSCPAPTALRYQCLLACRVRLTGVFRGADPVGGCGLGQFDADQVTVLGPIP